MADFSQNALRIDVFEEGPMKNWFRQKYGPVIQMIKQKLKNLNDSSHPLFESKDEIIKIFSEVYARDYEIAT